MANVIKHKRGSGSDPVANDLVVGEVAIRTDVGKLFTKMDNGSVAEIAGGGSDIAINTLSSSSGTGGGSATFNGSAYRFTLSAPPSVSAQQLLVSINGVIQKPVAGTGQPSEGFSVDGTDIILGDAPATGSDFFILTFKSLGVSEPADNSVTSAKIVDGAIVNADINASAAIAKTKIETFVNNNANDRVITGSNTANTLNGRSDFTFNGATTTITNSSGLNKFILKGDVSGGALGASLQLRNTNSANNGLTDIQFLDSGSNTYAKIQGTNLTDASNNGFISFFTSSATAGLTESVRIHSDGLLTVGNDPSGAATYGGQMVIATTTGGILTCADTGSGERLQVRGGGGITSVGSISNHSLIFYTNGASNERMRIDTSGKVGIGTTSPSSILDVLRSTDNATTSVITNNGTTGGNVLKLTSGGTGAGTKIFSVFKNNQVSETGVFAIDGSGKVGIGTTSPTLSSSAYQGLHIHQTASGGAKGSQIHLTNDYGGSAAGDGSHISHYNNYLYINNQENGSTYFYNNGSPTATILANGNFGVATQAPLKKLDVNGDIKASSIYFGSTNNANKLDGYEEGTFTPTFNFSTSTGSISYNVQIGRYTKIGNRVFYTCIIRSTSVTGTTSGQLRIAGLPFAVNSDFPSGGTCFFLTGGNFTTDYGVALQLNTSEQIEFYTQGQSSSTNYSTLTPSSLNVGALFIKVEGHYQT